MNFELLIGIGILVLGLGVIVTGALAKEQPLIYLFGLGVVASGAGQVVAKVMSPGPARIGAMSFFWIVSLLAFWILWRMARRLQGSRGDTPGQASGTG